jgi:hypothetical protein
MAQFETQIASSFQPTEWNAWISKADQGTIFQTSFWADRLCELWDCTPYYFTLSRAADLPVLMLLGFDIRSDEIRQENVHLVSNLKNTVFKNWRKKYRRFQWFGQPALVSPDAGGEAYRALFSAVEDFCRTNKISTLGPSEIPESAAACLRESWQKAEWATFMIDLQQGEDALWRNLKKTARKAIRSAQEDGLIVRQIRSLEDLRAYYEFACKCAARYGKKMHGFIDFKTMWQHFHTNAIFETFVAEKDGAPIAGLSVWGYNGIIAE